jgi:nucleoside-diphosphate-sugar epimerase
LYGIGTWFAPNGAVAEQIRRGEFVATGEITSFLHVEDAAHAAITALGWPKGKVNIADDEPAPAVDWAPVFAAAIGAPSPPVRAGAGSSHRGVSNNKARRKLGWQPIYTTWREGFKIGLGARQHPIAA